MNPSAPVGESSKQQATPWRTWPVHVRNSTAEAPDVFTLDLTFATPQLNEQFCFSPGQFNMLYVPGVGEAAISISGKTTSHLLQHTIRSVGWVTQALQAGGAGMSLGLRGPFGTAWPLDAMSQPAAAAHPSALRDIVIVAGGIGLAPLRALIEHLALNRAAYGEVSVLIGARTPADLLYTAEYDSWRRAAIEVKPTIDRPDSAWTGQVGVVTLLLERLPLRQPDTTLVLSCGPEVMMRYVAKSAAARGIAQENIWVALERNMNCAIGLCGHCQLGPEFICKDGPVFPYHRIGPWLQVQGL
ncbi:MAG: FAD/NAD(P)-binding protein [Planctomycetales bacterium]|nr:FAD/NAD(P)-binding protein [Planctomycetales bacterium]